MSKWDGVVVGIKNKVWSNYSSSSVVTILKFENVLSISLFVSVINGSNTLSCILLLTGTFNFFSIFSIVWISGSTLGGSSCVGSRRGMDLKMVVWFVTCVSSSCSATVVGWVVIFVSSSSSATMVGCVVFWVSTSDFTTVVGWVLVCFSTSGSIAVVGWVVVCV